MSLFGNLAAKVEGEKRRARAKGDILTPVITPQVHGDNYISDKVISMDTQHEETRGGSGLIHGSSLIGMCPRRQVLTIRAGKAPDRAVKTADRLVWAIGRAVEEHIRNQFIEAVDRKGVIASWRCKCGKSKVEGFYDRAVKCDVCKSHVDRFTELTLFDFPGNVVGNADMMYVRPDKPVVRTVEIKSMNKKDYDALTEPVSDHVTQAFINRRLAKINGLEVDDQVTLIYGCKDYAFSGRLYREFYISTSDFYEKQMDTFWERAKLVKSAEEDTSILPERIAACPNKTSPFAKKCDCCEACFVR